MEKETQYMIMVGKVPVWNCRAVELQVNVYCIFRLNNCFVINKNKKKAKGNLENYIRTFIKWLSNYLDEQQLYSGVFNSVIMFQNVSAMFSWLVVWHVPPSTKLPREGSPHQHILFKPFLSWLCSVLLSFR